MANPTTDRKALQDAMDAYSLYQSEIKGAQHLNISRSTLQTRLNRARALGITPTAGLDSRGSPKDLAAKVRRLEAELKARDRVSNDLEIIKGVVGAMRSRIESNEPPPNGSSIPAGKIPRPASRRSSARTGIPGSACIHRRSTASTATAWGSSASA